MYVHVSGKKQALTFNIEEMFEKAKSTAKQVSTDASLKGTHYSTLPEFMYSL
jgi:hypothetical protein